MEREDGHRACPLFHPLFGPRRALEGGDAFRAADSSRSAIGVHLFLVQKVSVANPHGYVGYIDLSLINQWFAACRFGLEP